MKNNTILLNTRPHSADDLAAIAHDYNLRLLNAPLMQIVPVAFSAQLPPKFGAIFTSANAVRASLHKLKEKPVFSAVVGGRTADALFEFGLSADIIASDITDLRQKMQRCGALPPMVHFRGRHVIADLVKTGDALIAPIVYDQIALDWGDAILQRLREALCDGPPVIAPIYSPRSARLFIKQIERLELRVQPIFIATISCAVTDVLTQSASKTTNAMLMIETATAPDRDGMHRAIIAQIEASKGAC